MVPCPVISLNILHEKHLPLLEFEPPEVAERSGGKSPQNLKVLN
jgi:hypothetical protein